MPSMLSVREERRSRSKSPGGREREHSRSNVRDDRDDDRRGERSRKSSRKYSESESEDSYEEDKRRYSSSKPSKKQYDSPSEEEKRRHRKSKYEEDERDDDRYRSSRSRKEEPRSKYRSPSASEDDRRSNRKSGRKKSESESEDDRRGSKRKESKKSSKNDVSSDNEDISIVIQRKSKSRKDDERGTTPRSSTSQVGSAAQMPSATVPYPPPGAYAFPPQPMYGQAPPGAFPDASRHMSYTGHDPRYAPPPVSQYAAPPPPEPAQRPRASSNVGPQYADPRQFQYAQVDPRVKYKYDDRKAEHPHDPKAKPQRRYDDDDDVITPEQLNRMREKKYTDDKYRSKEVRSSRDDPYSRDPIYRDKDDVQETARRVSRLSMSGTAAAGAGLGATLAVVGHAPALGGGKPPASPLLEAYKGTYQSISPMPSALVLANHKDDSDLSDLDLALEDDDESSGIDDNDANADIKRKIWLLEKEKKQHDKAEVRAQKIKEREREKKQREKQKEYERVRPQDDRFPADSDLTLMSLSSSTIKSPHGSRKSVSFYDAEDDAKEIAAALKGNKPPVVKPLIRILPSLTIDDLDALKAEYKKYAKIEGQGINLSKHIKARVTGYLGKAAYACSLGQWESEGFWANCYYQVGASRRELLIESLMGRTNQQIREIKNFFKDKKYDDDLEKCMRTELKADKFRSAILLALEERRMPETAPIDPRSVRDDVDDLYNTLHGPGGESAMIQIIVLRSDAHLRQVLRLYEQLHGQNFARAMINKSKNLVGETLAHILNGALNRPMRDALLLHQAIAETAPGKERAELLISRLVRMHWEPRHLEKVKEQYASRYNRSVETAIKKEIQANMKTEEGFNWTTFCINLLRSSEQ